MTNIEDIPVLMKVEDVAAVLGCSKSSAYSIMRRTDFPLIKLGGQSKGISRVRKQSFFEWLESQEKKEETK